MTNYQDITGYRNQGRSNLEIARFLGRQDPDFGTRVDRLDKMALAPWQKERLAMEGLDRWFGAGGSKPTPESNALGNLTVAPPRGILQRIKSSFGSSEEMEQAKQQEMAEGRDGFQWSDLPGDLADVAGTSLPFLTSIIGGAAGTVLSLPSVFGVPLGAVAGAGAGAAAGEGARRQIGELMGNEFESTDVVKDTAVQGAYGAGGEFGGQIIAKGVTKLAAPFKGAFKAELAAMYKKFGIEPTASMVSDSRAVPQIEALTKKSLFGSSHNEVLDDATQKLESYAQHLVESFEGPTDPTVAGKLIQEGAEEFRKGYLKTRSDVYKAAAKELERNAPEAMPFEETKGLLATYLKKKKNAELILGKVSLRDKLQTILMNMNPSESEVARGQVHRKFPYQVVSDALDELGYEAEKGGLLSTGDIAMLNNIKATMEKEFQSFMEIHAPDAFRALKRADTIAAVGYRTLNGRAGQIMSQLKEEPSRLVQALITPNSADRIPGLYGMIGPERANAVRGAFMKKIMEESTHPTTGLTGTRLQQTLKKYGEGTIAAALGDDRLSDLKGLMKMATGLQAGRKVAEGSQTAFLTRLTAIASTFFMNPVLTLKLLIGDAAMSKFIGSRAGIKWLTEGLEVSPAVQAGIRAGAQAGARKAADMIDPARQQ